MQLMEYNFEKFDFVKSPRLYSDKPFERKTFDPVRSYEDKKILNRLRGLGHARWFRRGWELWLGQRSSRPMQSTAMRALPSPSSFSLGEYKGKTVVDAGCGDSGDADLVTENGGIGIGYDLFPRNERYQFGPTAFRPAFTLKRQSRFKIQDVCETWPDEKQSVDIILCNAVLDLLTEEERLMFYKECLRVLKKDGVISLSFTPLKNGHHYDLIMEREKLRSVGFNICKHYGYGNCIIASPKND